MRHTALIRNRCAGRGTWPAGPEFLGTQLLAGDGLRRYILGTDSGREATETELREQPAWRMWTCDRARGPATGLRGGRRRGRNVDSVRNNRGSTTVRRIQNVTFDQQLLIPGETRLMPEEVRREARLSDASTNHPLPPISLLELLHQVPPVLSPLLITATLLSRPLGR